MARKQVIKVLLIEDDEDDVLLTREYLADSASFKFEVEWEPVTERAMEKMVSGTYDVFLIDYRLDSNTGLDIIKFAQDRGVKGPCILLTGQGDLRVDMDANRYGAADYLVKTDLNPSLLERSIRYSLSQARVVRELDEKEKRYRSLFERSIDPIFLADQQLNFIDVNSSFSRFFKLTKDEALNTSVRRIFTDENDFSYFKRTLEAATQVRNFEVSLSDHEGIKKVCLVNCVFTSDQQDCCYQAIVHDQTMRKKAEKDLLIAERLSMTGKIARTIAHEVRNPLTNLNLALEQLKDEMPMENESATLYADIIERNADRIEQLITEMLDSSRPKELNLELTPISDVLDDTISLTVDRLNLNRMKLEKKFDKDLPRILVDREKIKIAFLNIIINAVEAMQPGKGVLRIGTYQKDGRLVVSIVDNGKGIAPDEIEKLFDPFFTGKQGGMGLGLTSSKNIFNSHNAVIEVTSQVLVGTSFHIYFKLPDS
jgi:PAS domain S-box-containing protein